MPQEEQAQGPWDKYKKATPPPAVQSPNTSTEPAKQGPWNKYAKAKPAPTEKPMVEKAMPFSSGVASGMMLDPTKIAQQPTTMGQIGEVGKQMASGAKDFLKSVALDPLNIGKPIDAMVEGQRAAYKDVHEGLKSGNHDQLMHGLGLAVGNLGTILGGAKSAKEGMGITSAATSAKFATKDLASQRAIVSAASHEVLDTLKNDHAKALESAVKSEHARIGGNVQAINIADEAKDASGFKPKIDILSKVDKAITDKKAGVLLQKKMLPKVALVKGLIQGHPDALTFNQLKQVRTIVGSLLKKSSGVEYSILSDLDKSFTSDLKSRAAQLGKIKEWNEYNDATRKLAEHSEGIIPELQDTKTGLDYYKKIVSESNKPRLDKLIQDLHLPSDFFDKSTKGPINKIAYFAKLSEGDSFTSKLTNRIIAMKKHPIAASLGGGVGLAAGRQIGSALGMPMAGPLIGFAFGAGIAHDLISKYDAAKAIREIGGPSGVMGTPRSSQAPPSSMPPPQGQGPMPGGPAGQPLIPPRPPVTPEIITEAKSKVSPALAKLLPEIKEVKPKTSTTSYTGPERRVSTRDITGPDSMRQANMDRLRKIIGDKSIDVRDRAIAESQLNDLKAHPYERSELKGIKESKVQPAKMTREEAEAASAKRTEGRTQRFSGEAKPKIGSSQEQDAGTRARQRYWEGKRREGLEAQKIPEGQHGREPSTRSGMTKDTPEARRAKAAERVATRRAEASRTNIKASLEDQARQVAGRMDFQGKPNIELEQGLQELFGDNGKRFLAEFKKLAKQQKWSDEVYRGYLEDTLEKRADEVAKRPNIPGLGTESKN